MKIVYALTLTALLLVACNQTTEQNGKPIIVTTFYPLQQITSNIVGDTATVKAIVPAGSEPHDYEATPQDFIALNKADAFVTVGVEFAAFEDKLAQSVDGKLAIIPAATGIPLLDVTSPIGEETAPAETGKDPHVWVSPRNMMIMTDNVEQGLEKLHPENTAVYKANAESYKEKLAALDKEFSEGLASCKKHTVLVNHQAFAYLGKDYGFTQIGIAGLEPETEPTPGQVAAIVNEAKKENITYVFYESLVDPKVAKAIAAEAGAQSLLLDPIEGAADPNDTYISIMQRNLANLKIALECS